MILEVLILHLGSSVVGAGRAWQSTGASAFIPDLGRPAASTAASGRD